MAISSSSSSSSCSSLSTTRKILQRRRQKQQRKSHHFLCKCSSSTKKDDEKKSIIFVRHGQSTWNERGIIQGSSDESVLTELGETQARRSFELLKREKFDYCLRSPLQRAHRTAEVIWGEERSKDKMNTIHDLREIDLYAFQGLDKNDKETIEKREFTNCLLYTSPSPRD